MLHAGLDLSRRRLDVCLLDEHGELVAETAAPPDADGLRGLARRLAGQRVRAVIESMNGARFVHDTLEEFGWEVLVADAQRVKGLAPLACKTDKIDAQVLALLSQRDLVPAIWLPDPSIRRERELQIARLTCELKRQGAEHRYIPLLVTAPGFGWINAFTVASEIGDIERFASPSKLCGYTGLCPRVVQSGSSDRRGPISKHGPRYLRWGLFEAAMNACKHPFYAERYQRTKRHLRPPARAQGRPDRALAQA